MSDCLVEAYKLLNGDSSEFASKIFFEGIGSAVTYDEFLGALEPFCETLVPYVETLIFTNERDLSDTEIGAAILEFVASDFEEVNNILSENNVELSNEELLEMGIAEAGIRDVFKKTSQFERFIGGLKKSAKEAPDKIKDYTYKKVGIKTPGEQVKEKLKAKGVDLKDKAIQAGKATKAKAQYGLEKGKQLGKTGMAKTKELYGSLKSRVARYQKQRRRQKQIKNVKAFGKKWGKRVGVGAAVVGAGALAIKLALAVRAARKWKKEKCGGLSGNEALMCQSKAAKMAIDDLKKFRSQECKNRKDPVACEKAATENINMWTSRLNRIEAKRRA